MKSLYENAQAIVDDLRKAESQLTDDQRLSTGLFAVRRQLQAHIAEHERAGERIPIRKQFRIDCVKCGKVQQDEEEYYLHLRKVHGMDEGDTVEESNRPRTEYDGEVQELRRLLAAYTDFDTEDDFTKDIDEANLPDALQF